jgi:hypothetical protein
MFADSLLEEERFESPVPLGRELPETSNEAPPRRVEESCSEKHPVSYGGPAVRISSSSSGESAVNPSVQGDWGPARTPHRLAGVSGQQRAAPTVGQSPGLSNFSRPRRGRAHTVQAMA